MALQMNWLKRYINNNYDDYWTKILDQHLNVTVSNRKKILNYGSEYFSPLIQSCKFAIIVNMIKNLQVFLREFVTEAEAGDNRFIFQSSLHNRNIREGGLRTKRMLTPTFYGWPPDLQICVNELFKMDKFISFDDFLVLFKEKTGKTLPQSPVS